MTTIKHWIGTVEGTHDGTLPRSAQAFRARSSPLCPQGMESMWGGMEIVIGDEGHAAREHGMFWHKY